MCGIAGIIDLAAQRPVDNETLERMARAIVHRGPDDDGYFTRPGLGMASRRLSIVGLVDGRQPVFNENRSVAAVFNGELFDYPELKEQLEARGHRLLTRCDTELIPHLWEEHEEDIFEHLRGQFAVAVWDERRRRLIMGRDRFGICPLYWTRQGDWLLFASEIKALLASGMVEARADLRGIDQVFNFFSIPGPHTCFEGVETLLPGHYLRIQLSPSGQPAEISNRTYFAIDFPDQGQEDRSRDPRRLMDELEGVLQTAVERRLRADVPVVGYLSGGIDSSMVMALAKRRRGHSIPSFTIRVKEPGLDETVPAGVVSKHLGAEPVVVDVGREEVLHTYPALIRAAEGPVVDTSCTAMLLLARAVHAHGYKVALTGEGSDEWLGGYPWFKFHRLLSFLDVIPGLPLSMLARRAGLRLLNTPRQSIEYAEKLDASAGGHGAFQDLYGLMSRARLRFYSPRLLEELADHDPYQALQPDLERMKRWHPFNRSLYWGARIHLAGHLLTFKGDRVAMHSSVETRYPFLDEDVFRFLAGVDPRWKMRGFRDKYLLRRLGERHLPRSIAWAPKGMFRAPLRYFLEEGAPPYVEQLLSEESLRKTGYFDPAAVQYWRTACLELRANSPTRIAVELGFVGVVATQLWHQTFIDHSLAEVPDEAGCHEPVASAQIERALT